MRRGLLVAVVIMVVGCSSGTTTGTGTTVPQPTTIGEAATTTTPVPKEKAEDFIKRHITEIADGQYGPSYNNLLPQQQAMVPRAIYINCFEKQPAIEQVKSLTVVKVYTESSPTPGAGDLDSTAVTIKVGLAAGPQTITLHAYNVNGTWKASMDQTSFDAESKGRCKP